MQIKIQEEMSSKQKIPRIQIISLVKEYLKLLNRLYDIT